MQCLEDQVHLNMGLSDAMLVGGRVGIVLNLASLDNDKYFLQGVDDRKEPLAAFGWTFKVPQSWQTVSHGVRIRIGKLLGVQTQTGN